MKTETRTLTPTKQAQPGETQVKIFISHSSKDSSLVTLITDLLKTSDLQEHEIRCTSVDSHGLHMGATIAEVLRDDIEECEIMIAVLTKDALDSREHWGLSYLQKAIDEWEANEKPRTKRLLSRHPTFAAFMASRLQVDPSGLPPKAATCRRHSY